VGVRQWNFDYLIVRRVNKKSDEIGFGRRCDGRRYNNSFSFDELIKIK